MYLKNFLTIKIQQFTTSIKPIKIPHQNTTSTFQDTFEKFIFYKNVCFSTHKKYLRKAEEFASVFASYEVFIMT